MVGEGDIVTLDHTSTVFLAIPNSELAVLRGALHLLTMEDLPGPAAYFGKWPSVCAYSQR